MDKFFLIAGPCAIEERSIAFDIAGAVNEICSELGIDYTFKASYRKANRSKLNSFTGIGNQNALEIIKEVKETFRLKAITDIHESYEAEQVKDYVDCLQIPAFLCRQTDLLLAAGKTGLTVNIKKGQFVSPESMSFAIEKVKSTGNNKVWVTERGFSFGYNDLVVDATAVKRLTNHGVPVIMDCTHSVQKPNQTVGITGGDPTMIETIALSAIATGATGLFLEVHPEPKSAKSDPHTMLQLNKLRPILEKCLKVQQAISS